MITVRYIEAAALITEAGAAALPKALGPKPAWVDIVAPDDAERAALQATLGLHELALEDAARSGHPPKLEEFEGHLFLIAHTPEREVDQATRKVALFLAKGWVATIVREPLSAMKGVRGRVDRDPAQYLKGPDQLAAMLLDAFTDGFEQNVEAILERVEALEARAIADPVPATLNAILAVRAEVSELNRIVRSQRDVFAALQHTPLPVISKKMQPYVRDIYDHIVRVRDLLEGARDHVAAARDAYLAASGNRMNEIMRTLTVVSTTLLPLALITGFFGMNFDPMPGTKGETAFWITVGVMTTIAVSLLLWFKHKRWL